ncbi:short-chain dehydrogenase/reductase SDR [Dinoroseobacter shibae DFL 12 = DSM 16493]|jgi:NAD(P)-dependent dehydrogenase (short-subunit alcohol dehydrogenase family)|uniref:Short-chain dehydrogenase/reductase SDR n=1 Tax=Dinoroseobacter shibae (strain DSM 16493 / NCIMB 14021 / DFL 12) TaxID=398580 RepID=A8LIY6_DINSH|nr:SDR family oxidoreductase [Dinoroseobacter shibae]ABV93100.1 short-chain dehydrogenase/reductase SDR [Dinoroseobacter shibae DFL 12 = DSM 16493]URF48029.1 SDR family oxidoreductase [Dinoroseobacter shibae]URF52338.1 SDR family oxidoreductase [Dinoroseobacter shibae]
MQEVVQAALFKRLFGLEGKRALITGASSGIGAHLALTLGQAGAEVILAARRADRLEAVAETLRAEGIVAQTAALDVTDAASVAAAVTTVGPLDILINNSGVSGQDMVIDTTEADWDRVLDTNLKGAWRVSRAFAPGLIARQGTILNVASILGIGVLKTVGPYAASKAGLIQLTRAMALELARDGVRVNALAPGYIETPINTEFFASEAGQKMLRGVPQRRLGQPGDLDAAVLMLLGPGAGFVTGATVVVDGGHTLALS